MPKITKLYLNLSKLCLEYCGLFFPLYSVYYIHHEKRGAILKFLRAAPKLGPTINPD